MGNHREVMASRREANMEKQQHRLEIRKVRIGIPKRPAQSQTDTQSSSPIHNRPLQN